MFLIGLLVFQIIPMPHDQIVEAASTGFVKRVYTDKARYNPNSNITITAELNNSTSQLWNGEVFLNIFHLESKIMTQSQIVSLNPGETKNINFNWTAPSKDFQGYFVEVVANNSVGTTAIDVSSKWTQYPRYGFLTEYPVGESSADTNARVKKTVEDYHVNAFQFYDWMWRHENMIKRTNGIIDSQWTDWSGKLTISWETIQNLIDSAHQYNAAAMPYTMTYAALQDYEQISEVSPQWGMYYDNTHQNQLVFDFVDNKPETNLWLFNPANTGWQNYIFGQYRDSILTAGFDGIHLDQMGERSDPFDYNGNVVDLDHSFSGFINNLKSNLQANGLGNKTVTFNMVDGVVNGWAVNDVVTNANTDFDYSEIWYKADDYIELKDYVADVRKKNGGKPLVLAAYMNYEENTGTRYEAENARLINVGTNTNHTGFTGSGFVDQFGDTGDKVEFTISVPENGKYSLVFRYANDTGNTSTRSVYVDGKDVKQIEFLDQNDWDAWAFDAYALVELNAGTHTVSLQKDIDDNGFINLDSLTLGTFDEHSVRLTNAAIAASGAFHIEMGEGDQMLGHPYFPNQSKQMRNSLKDSMKHHYNFITAYENLLFDEEVIPNDSGTQFVDITGETVSGDGSSNTIWSIYKRSNNYNIVHLINLSNNDTKWRNSAAAPSKKTNLQTKVYIGGNETISNIYVASPDIDGGKTKELNFTSGSDSKGKYVLFTVPSLEYWDMIYMKRSFSTPANDIYEAEKEILSNTAVDTDHPGYTGTGFVDQFAEVNDGVSFTVKATTNADYVLRFKYANGGSDATRDVYVDGKYAGTVQFKNTGNWDTWKYGELTVSLKEGHHSIVLWYNLANNGTINLDHLDMDKAYIWEFDRQISSVPAGYRIVFRVGQQGWVHWGTNGWQNVTDTPFSNNGSSNAYEDFETSIGPFTSGTTVEFTFLWDDNNNGILETNIDRWEGKDFRITVQ
jgi:Glycosyl hydrolase family 66/Carbohydrate binding module (family 35)